MPAMLGWLKKVPQRVVAPMRQKFEYKVVFAHMPIAQQILNDTAADGWRLVCKADEQFIFERGL